jgi:hypothetical protein
MNGDPWATPRLDALSEVLNVEDSTTETCKTVHRNFICCWRLLLTFYFREFATEVRFNVGAITNCRQLYGQARWEFLSNESSI